MVKKILTIGYELPGKSNELVNFNEKRSLMDTDILIFSPETPDGYDDQYQGKPSYSDTGSFQYREATQHWKKELANFLSSGRTVFLFLTEKESFFLKTGTKEYKPKMTINHVDQHHNYEFLPISIGTITTAKGKVIEFAGNGLFSKFFKTFKKSLEYKVYLENIGNASVIFTGKDKTKILGALYKVGVGNLVVLPYPEYNRSKFIKYKKDKKGKESGYWTPDAIKFGHALGTILVEIDSELTREGVKTPPPTWVARKAFNSTKESSLREEVEQNIKKVQEIEEVNKKLNADLIEEQSLKDLLFEQGTPLELAVIQALEILGYKAENFNDGELELDQVITSPESHRYIGECEGKDNKDIDIIKFRQLLESMNADFARDEVEEKAFGILFGNAQRLTDPKDRTLDFTKKCKIGAEREKIALVRTIDLFTVAKFLKETPDGAFQKSCRDAVHNGLGSIVQFPVVPSTAE
ncbi:MAG: hypothetical protein O3B47_05635 [bacterium]|nr:hypothetical protein [bacterium]